MVFYTLANRLHETIYDMCLRNFGLKPMPFVFTEYAKYDEKTGEKLNDRRELKGERMAPGWAIREARFQIVRGIRRLLNCCTRANLIYPVTLIDFGERRKYQTKAISECSILPRTIEFYSRKIGYKLEPWKHIFRDLIELEKVLRGWRSSDKVFEQRILKAYAKKEIRIRRDELRKFLQSHGTFLDTEDLKVILETEDPWEILNHMETLTNEIIFGVTPKIRKLLNDEQFKNNLTKPKSSPFEKKVDGKYSHFDMYHRNNSMIVTDNPAPPDPPIPGPKDPTKKQKVVDKLPNGQIVTYFRDPTGMSNDTPPKLFVKKPYVKPPAPPTIAELVANGTYSKVMEEAYAEHNAEVEKTAKEQGEAINKEIVADLDAKKAFDGPFKKK
jgi:hypothetical protein